jgi:membrane fusion protein (multidrug efflux system)
MKAIFFLLAATVLAFTHAGCGSKKADGKTNGGGALMVPVETARVTTERIEEKLSGVGSLEANEAVDIKSEIDAIVDSIAFTEGASVKKGQLLVKFDAAKWRAQHQQAKVELENARIRAERSDKLLKSDSVSQQEYDDAHAAARTAEANFALLEARLKETEILAPFDGLVSERLVSPGAYVKAGDPLVRLVDLDPIKISFSVPERYMTELKLGQQVTMRTASIPGRAFTGEVYFIDPQVEVATRTIKVKAKTDNSDAVLRPGLFANVELTLRVLESALVIPEEAILAQVGATIVFVVADQQAMIRPVKTGLRIPGKVQITEGLKADEEVVTGGHQKLFPGVKVTAAPKG